MANLGYIGLGVMGGVMVNRLTAKGHSVTGHNRTPAKAQWLLDKGMKWGEYLTAGRATGLEKEDFAAMFQVLVRLSGVNE